MEMKDIRTTFEAPPNTTTKIPEQEERPDVMVEVFTTHCNNISPRKPECEQSGLKLDLDTDLAQTQNSEMCCDINGGGGDEIQNHCENEKSNDKSTTPERSDIVHINNDSNPKAWKIQDSNSDSTSNSQPWKRYIRSTIYTAMIILYLVYFGFAVALNFDRAIPLVVFTSVAFLVSVWKFMKFLLRLRQTTSAMSIGGNQERLGQRRHLKILRHLLCLPGSDKATSGDDLTQEGNRTLMRFNEMRKSASKFCGHSRVKNIFYAVVTLSICGFLVSEHYDHLDRLRPLLGLVTIVVVSLIVSYDRSKINWRPVTWGLVLQVCLGLVTLRTRPGRDSFRFLGRRMEIFLDHVMAGVLFVFGEKYSDFFFIFKLMPVVIFLSSMLSILYHIGAMQRIVGIIASVMSVTMTTTAAESTATAACIFLGQPEASLTIRPFLQLMTRSELFAITTAGFSSVTADVFAIFVHYGMPSSHIVTAVLMSAPASIAVSKMICPETEISQTKDLKELRKHEKKMTRHRSVLDAAVQGAQDAVGIVVAVVATIIAFLSILSFLNSVMGYLGQLVNIQGLSLETLMSYPLMPVSYLLGVAWEDCGPVAELIGLKTFVNELVAYQRLQQMVERGGIKHIRSRVIAMYALCGFSNPTSVGVTLGGLSAMVPQKTQVLASTILMSWLAGCLACFMTAAWAGLLFTEEDEAGWISNVTSTL